LLLIQDKIVNIMTVDKRFENEENLKYFGKK
jgi:hypothetical protein